MEEGGLARGLRAARGLAHDLDFSPQPVAHVICLAPVPFIIFGFGVHADWDRDGRKHTTWPHLLNNTLTPRIEAEHILAQLLEIPCNGAEGSDEDNAKTSCRCPSCQLLKVERRVLRNYGAASDMQARRRYLSARVMGAQVDRVGSLERGSESGVSGIHDCLVLKREPMGSYPPSYSPMP